MGQRAKPTSVTAMAANGVAKKEIGVDCEDTITLMTKWKNKESGNEGVGVYTSVRLPCVLKVYFCWLIELR